MKPGSPKPFFIRAAELLGQMGIDGRKMDKTPDYIRTPSYTEDGKSLDSSLCKMRKGTPNKIFHTIIIMQRGVRSHHRRNAEASDNGGQRNDIY
jgi:hypothetical protein